MEYCSGTSVKGSEIMDFAGKWRDHEIIILSEVTQTQKVKHPRFLSLGAPASKSAVTTKTRRVKQDRCQDRGVGSNRGG